MEREDLRNSQTNANKKAKQDSKSSKVKVKGREEFQEQHDMSLHNKHRRRKKRDAGSVLGSGMEDVTDHLHLLLSVLPDADVGESSEEFVMRKKIETELELEKRLAAMVHHPKMLSQRRKSRSLDRISVSSSSASLSEEPGLTTRTTTLNRTDSQSKDHKVMRHSRSLSDSGVPQLPVKTSFINSSSTAPSPMSTPRVVAFSNNPNPSAWKSTERRIKLNIGGQIFETYASTLTKYPNTLLGAMFHQRNIDMLAWDKDGHFFFDRDPRVFEVILNFYRTGKLIKPQWVPMDLLREELRFFSMDVPLDSFDHKRISVEMMKLQYKDKIFDASEYRRITRHKLLSEHHGTLIKVALPSCSCLYF
eukprot:TRINITY_DN6665_c0_g1_i2.p1 TRINITY_DN6665_c0_g1~~TRINITY_DN6665_c0_g1_i2.p1  ORF type:complete len:362 (+),score=67.40 TRINITY_DN6665_c0_g1_i2:21-1106(+)